MIRKLLITVLSAVIIVAAIAMVSAMLHGLLVMIAYPTP